MSVRFAYRILSVFGATLPLSMTYFQVAVVGTPMEIVWPAVTTIAVLLFPILWIGTTELLWRLIVER